MQQVPYWRLSGFYFFYFAVLGALVPYWSLYLKGLGFTAVQIGLLAAIIQSTKMIVPNFWAWLADRSGQQVPIIRAGSLMATVFFCGLFLDQRFGWVLLVFSLHSFFWNAVLPQYEVLTLNSLRGQYQHYSRIRLWGSIGFVLSLVLLGRFFDAVSILRLPRVVAWLLVLIWLCSLTVRPADHRRVPLPRGKFLAVLRRPVVMVFLVCCFLMQFSHGPYYTFFSVYLKEHAYSATQTGVLWAVGVVAEIALFTVMHRVLPRFGIRTLLLASFGLAALRWLVIGFWIDSWVLLFLAQCLHAATFGSFHAASIELVRRLFGEGCQAQGQALYSAVSYGAGGALGAIASGLAWDSSPAWVFAMAAAAAGLACLLAWGFLRSPEMDDLS